MSFINQAWDEYRGWANRSREKKARIKLFSRVSLITTIIAVIAGAAAAYWANTSWEGTLAGIAAVAALLTGMVGTQLLTPKQEKYWLLARALAASIKSECFLATAGVGPYSGNSEERSTLLLDWLQTETQPVTDEGLTQPQDQVRQSDGDARRPTENMDLDWYLENRLRDQQRYFADRQLENERFAKYLRWTSISMAALAATSGALGIADGKFGSWVAALIAVGSAVAAYGLIDRRAFLAAHYGAMATALNRILGWATNGERTMQDVVKRTEAALQAESAAWATTLTSQIKPSEHSVGTANDARHP